VKAIEEGQRLVGRRPTVERSLKKPFRFIAISVSNRSDAPLKQLLRFTLPLGQRAARTIDVRPCARMTPIEKERARPDVDRLFVACSEVMVEASDQQSFNFGVTLGIGGAVDRP
jgi:hypothetical protein